MSFQSLLETVRRQTGGIFFTPAEGLNRSASLTRKSCFCAARTTSAVSSAIPENRDMKKMKFSCFSHQRHALSTSFDIAVVTYRVTNYLPKLVDMLLFSVCEKTEFPFFEIPYFRVLPFLPFYMHEGTVNFSPLLVTNLAVSIFFLFTQSWEGGISQFKILKDLRRLVIVKANSHLWVFISQREIQDQLEFKRFCCEIAHTKPMTFEKETSSKCLHTCEKFARNFSKCE